MTKKKISENIFNTAIVEKRNVLNEIHKNNMSLQELRFFSIYLSKINARDMSTRVVKFSLEDFKKIMGFQSLNLTQIRQSFIRLLQQCVSVPNEKGRGFSAFQLFKKCKLLQDEYGEWYVEIDAHDDALPLMFDFRNRYFTYELWNALRLKSTNQIRMYEVLKQYETIGKREISVTELKELLGITSTEYPRWNNFKTRVLDSCQQALADNTDITYTYEKGKSGKGGKWLTIVFYIQKNNKHIDQLTLEKFINLQPNPSNEIEKIYEYSNEMLKFLAEACKFEFNEEEMKVLFNCIASHNDKIISKTNNDYLDLARYDYLSSKYSELNLFNKKNSIKNRFFYFRKMIYFKNKFLKKYFYKFVVSQKFKNSLF